ncbi:MAG TPA: putative DNA modification/repair radical SAM protein [Thermoanaerobaculia bacterium]
MELRSKLAILADAAKYDASCASSGAKRSGNGKGLGSNEGTGICHSYTPDGRCVSLLKILLTNHCVYDCRFCVNRVTSDIPRARFTPEEVVTLTLDFYRRNYIEGLFLSSGILQSPDHTMEQMVAVARRLREDHAFNGYIHLKAVPGASPELIAEAGRWADRLSANIELPTQGDLDQLAPEKKRPVIETTMAQIRDRRDEAETARKESPKAPRFAPAGQSTQMVVGASESPDAAILETASDLYQRHRLRRVYYTAFSPFPNADPRLPVKPAPLIREHRLYQADWLIRHYGFQATELTTPEQPNLDLKIDPKLSWALRHRAFFPVDVNRDSRSRLLRVPGLGSRNVDRILKARRFGRLTLTDLAKLRISLDKARPFVVTADHNPDALLIDRADLGARIEARAVQLPLFGDAATTAVTGEL